MAEEELVLPGDCAENVVRGHVAGCSVDIFHVAIVVEVTDHTLCEDSIGR